MKRITAIAVAVFMMTAIATSCKKKEKADQTGKFEIDSTKFEAFFKSHPDFSDYQKDVAALYRKHGFKYVWYDKEGRNDFAEVLYSKARSIGAEGVPVVLPYGDQFSELFRKDKEKPDLNNELLISSMYFFYAKKVYEGVDPQQSKQMGWYLPRERKSYVGYLDELMKDADLIQKDKDENISMYYNLRKGLQRYRKIRDNGGWGTITLPAGTKSLKPGANSPAVVQLRKRLAATGDISSDSRSAIYDKDLVTAVKSWQIRQGLNPDGIVGPDLVKALNISVEYCIKTIIVNMERCRWLSPDITDVEEYIAVNIPSFRMRYVRDGKVALESDVIVGDEANKTVVFSGKMSYLVFSPYWNVPKSIIAEEIQPELDKNPNYLEEHNMEWNDGNIRQKPGDENSLGLVKFMFPNSNNIYLHDTPGKSLFNKDDRALSHGCVRVQKARELAIMLMSQQGWNAQRVDAAMHSGEEKNEPLKRKIPVYIAYFTALADANGNVSFYDDIYNRDNRLAKLLYKD